MMKYKAYLNYFNAFINSIVIFWPTLLKSECVGSIVKEGPLV